MNLIAKRMYVNTIVIRKKIFKYFGKMEMDQLLFM